MRRTWGSACVFVFIALASASGARADAIGPLPERCPEGSVAQFCHGPPTCRAVTCTSDAECGEGMACRERALCTREHCCGGRCCGGGCGGGEPPSYTHVAGECQDGGCLELGTSCTSLKVCVPAGSVPDAGSGGTDAGSGGTDAGGTDAGRDGGGSQADGGRRDAGGSRDAGSGAETDGGCCSVSGRRSAVGGALFVALAVVAMVRLARRR